MAATETNVTEASKMLEAALQQMDGIISGTSNNNGNSNNSFTSPSPTPSIKTENSSQMQSEMQNNAMTSDNILVTAKTLALALKQVIVELLEHLYKFIEYANAFSCFRLT